MGHSVGGRPIEWSVDHPSVLDVDTSGTLTALSPGLATLRASVDGINGTFSVSVVKPKVVALVAISLNVSSLSAGDSTQASAYVYDSLGAPIRGRTTVWSLRGDRTAATVSQQGVITALAPGSVILVATVDNVYSEFPLIILPGRTRLGRVTSVAIMLAAGTLPVGASTMATAFARDSNGTIIDGRTASWSMTGAGAVATVSSTGAVSAIGVGTATLTATVDGVAGTALVTVVDTVGSSKGVLPTLPDTIAFSYPVVKGKKWMVRRGDNLQAALNGAKRGDEISLEAGATFTGNFTLPSKSGTPNDGWIILRSEALAQLPAAGTRVNPANAGLMAKIVTNSPAPALATDIRASGWWIAGVEMAIAPSFSAVQFGIVRLGDGSAAQNDLSKVATDLVLDRVYIHAQPNQNTSRCIELNSARTIVRDSYLMDCHGKGFDSQAILGWNGPGPFRIENNMLGGVGENVMFGGADPQIRGLIPSDIVVRRNYIYSPVTWKGVWTKKNLLEIKSVQRILIEGNVLDGSWADGQNGYAFVLKSVNQGGRCTWCAARDITIRYNLVRNSGSGFGLSGKDPGVVSEHLGRLLIEQNVVENISVGAFQGDGRLVSVMNDVQDLTIRHNTMTSTGAIKQFLEIGDPPGATNFVYDDNLATHGAYGLFSSTKGVGEVALQNVRGAVSFKRNALVGPQMAGYPNTRFYSSLSAASGSGAGANRIAVDAATKGVAIP